MSGLLLVALLAGLGRPGAMAEAGDETAFASRRLPAPVTPNVKRAYGVAIGDLDGDGRLDLLFMNHQRVPTLLLNLGRSGFVNASGRVGLGAWPDRHAAALGDWDNDGTTDLLITVGAGRGELRGRKRAQLFRNRGGALEIRPRSAPPLNPDGRGRTARFVDVDRDGWLDLYFGNYESPNVFYRGSATGEFVEATSEIGLDGLVGAHQSWVDLDGDGWLDLFTAPELAFHRNVGGRFELQERSRVGLTGRWLSGMAWGDMDGDGDLDLFHAANRPRVYRNDGGVLVPAAKPAVAGRVTSAAWGDLDADGRLDLAVASVDEVRLFRGSASGLGETGRAVGPGELEPGLDGEIALVDIDADGDLDLVVNSPRRRHLWTNEGSGGAWMSIRLRGRGSALGSRVRLRGETLSASAQHLGSPGSTASSGDAPLFFGLGDETGVSLSVEWPSGARQRIESLPSRRALVLVEPSG